MTDLINQHLDIWTTAITSKATAGRGNKSPSPAGEGRGEGSPTNTRNAKYTAYGIKKLRELILELAVRGKLMPQETDWRQTRLSDLGEWAIGSGFPKNEQGKEGLEILFAKVSDMNLPGNEKFIVTTNHTISIETARKLGINVHASGTVIFPKIGGAIATNKRRILTRLTAIDNNCLGITPKENVSTDWLYLVLSSIDFTKYQAGTSVPALSQGTLAKIYSTLPSLAEQHLIVAKVDELMALCEQLEQQQTDSIAAHQTLVQTLLETLTQAADAAEFEQAWSRIADHFDTLFTTEASIDQLKQTLLQLAVMGKLVPQDPNDEPASVLLDKITDKKAWLVKEGKTKTQKPFADIADEAKVFEIPNSWEWGRLGSVSVLKGGFAYNSSSFISSGKHQVIRMGNIRPDCLRINENPVYISPELGAETIDYRIEPNDILLTMTGTNGKRDYLYSLMVNPENCKDRDLYLNQRLCIVRILLLSPEFLNMVIKDDRLLDAIYAQSTGTANQANIGMAALSNWVIPIPPIEEQSRIVSKVYELMALCDALKARIAAAQAAQVQLADAIVEQAIA